MAQYDGVFKIITKITVKDAEESLAGLEWQIKNSAKYMNELRSKMDALKDQKIPTEKYKDLQNKLSDAEKELSGLVEQQEKYIQSGFDFGGGWDSLIEKVASASDKVDSIKEKMQSLTDAGKDFVLGKDTRLYAMYQQQFREEEEAVVKAGQKYKELSEKTPKRLNARQRRRKK